MDPWQKHVRARSWTLAGRVLAGLVGREIGWLTFVYYSVTAPNRYNRGRFTRRAT